jgi:hypothetical protein
MRHFVDDDAGYARWLAEYPRGFVVNTFRSPSAAYLMLHRADCATISGEPARGLTFTGGEYTKVCGSREELEDFAGQLGGQTAPCGLCLRQGQLRPQDRTRSGGRYGPLGVHLAGQAGSYLQMSFAQIEALVGPLAPGLVVQRVQHPVQGLAGGRLACGLR